jgi:hypothetical protein
VVLAAACKTAVYETSEVDDERFKSFTTHCELTSAKLGPFVYRHRTAVPQAAKAGSIPARVTDSCVTYLKAEKRTGGLTPGARPESEKQRH